MCKDIINNIIKKQKHFLNNVKAKLVFPVFEKL